jgi:aldehyde oxidoreductase
MIACGIPTIDVIPDEIDLILIENKRPDGPFGSCGCSEDFQSSQHMAVINAISNAAGVRIFDLPATPAKVKEALEKVSKGESLIPPKYVIGKDFEEELAEIQANPM